MEGNPKRKTSSCICRMLTGMYAVSGSLSKMANYYIDTISWSTCTLVKFILIKQLNLEKINANMKIALIYRDITSSFCQTHAVGSMMHFLSKSESTVSEKEL